MLPRQTVQEQTREREWAEKGDLAALPDLSASRIVQRCHFEKTSVLLISSLQGEECLPPEKRHKESTQNTRPALWPGHWHSSLQDKLL